MLGKDKEHCREHLFSHGDKTTPQQVEEKRGKKKPALAIINNKHEGPWLTHGMQYTLWLKSLSLVRFVGSTLCFSPVKRSTGSWHEKLVDS